MFKKILPCDVGISSCAPWIPCTNCPDAKINCGIVAGPCCEPIMELGGAIDGGWWGWVFIGFVIIPGGVSAIVLCWVLLGVIAEKKNIIS